MEEKIKVLINEEEIAKRIQDMANQISEDYKNEEIILICILKGAAYFGIDLSKKIVNNEIIMEFMKVNSYGISKRESTGEIDIKLDISTDISNKNVIIVDDILDSGLTLDYLYNYLKAKNPKDLKTCVLLDKKERRKKDINADYVGFEIENKFVLGYGMDYDEKFRNLPYIGYVEE